MWNLGIADQLAVMMRLDLEPTTLQHEGHFDGCQYVYVLGHRNYRLV